MKVSDAPLPGVLVLEPSVFEDERGFFMEAWNARTFERLGIRHSFVQDNHSRSRQGVLRGLHYQLGAGQAKLVRVLSGRIFDVAVDVRRGSPTFGQWTGLELSSENRRMLFLPEGFAHGFCVIGEGADVAYKTSSFYDKSAERGIRWDDPTIGIRWPLDGTPLVSDKDADLPLLAGMSAEDLPEYEI